MNGIWKLHPASSNHPTCSNARVITRPSFHSFIFNSFLITTTLQIHFAFRSTNGKQNNQIIINLLEIPKRSHLSPQFSLGDRTPVQPRVFLPPPLSFPRALYIFLTCTHPPGKVVERILSTPPNSAYQHAANPFPT